LSTHYSSTVETPREDRLKFAKHFERAQGWLLLDKHVEAISALDEIPTIFQIHPAVVLLRAHVHMDAKQWKLAEPLLRQLIKEDEGEPQYWINLAYVVRRAKSLKEAEPILREARKRFPTVALIWFNLACYASQETRLQEAHDLLREALRLESTLMDQAKADADLAPYWEGLKSGQITASS
jgi:predicted Zn-dependent protease